ncbi:MAG: methylenetetrahydrofolate reductase [NAD(P)H] [Bacteroidales bacterium]|nr:methylenetetrahydrofolate reductase [NAD(P)H] [Bacteroidales bacterium]
MSVAEILKNNKETAFSFEVLPPIKGNSIDKVFNTIEKLKKFNPAYINITTHRTDIVYKETEPGIFRQVIERKRPGTVAIAAAIKAKYAIPTVPHIICSGFSKAEIEYELIDLSFLGITDLLVLRGDKSKNDPRFIASLNGHQYACELQEQINEFNDGHFIDGSSIENVVTPFSYGTAGYPEKHEEAMNLDADLRALKNKVDLGAQYIVTQMFFDNSKYFNFVERCRSFGINVPIVPGLKPLTSLNHQTMLPKTFHIDFPEPLAKELEKCSDNESARNLGIEWCVYQAKELKAANVPSIHFYSMNAVTSVESVAAQVY